MINKISDSKYFQKAKEKYNYDKLFEKVDFNNYIIPYRLIEDRLYSFRGYKYPLVQQVIDAVHDKVLIPSDFTTSTNINCKTGNIFTNFKLPRQMFNLTGYINRPIIYSDLSAKGKYQVSPQGIVTYYDIPDIILYHMLSGGYIQYKLVTDMSISQSKDFIFKIAELYTLIVSKVIDNLFPIISTTKAGSDRLNMLVMAYCMQTMFYLTKEEALSLALKSKFIVYKQDVMSESIYYQSDLDFVKCEAPIEFPIDNFCHIICKEFTHIDERMFNANILSLAFKRRLQDNSIFALETAPAFIHMITMSSASIGLYTDRMVQEYTKLCKFDIAKEIAVLAKGR